MGSLIELIEHEYKKIFKRKSTIIMLILSLGTILFLSTFSLLDKGYYFHSYVGEDKSAIESMNLDKAVILSKVGVMDEALIKEAIEQNQIMQKDEDNFEINRWGRKVSTMEATIEYKLPYDQVVGFINHAYISSVKTENGEYPIDKLSPKDAENFYANYKNILIDYANNIKPDLTQAEKELHLKMIDEIETPFNNDYLLSYSSFRGMYPIIGLLILTAIAIICSQIFANEYQLKVDSLILTSKHGKNKVIVAKIITGISFSAIIPIVFSGSYMLLLFAVCGFTGHDVSWQIADPFSSFPITMAEAVIICIAVSVFVSVAFGIFTMLISAKNKTPFGAIVVALMVAIIPMFIPLTSNRYFLQFVLAMPLRTFDTNAMFSKWFYSFGSISLTPGSFYILISVILVVVMTPLIYRTFKNHQVT